MRKSRHCRNNRQTPRNVAASRRNLSRPRNAAPRYRELCDLLGRKARSCCYPSSCHLGLEKIVCVTATTLSSGSAESITKSQKSFELTFLRSLSDKREAVKLRFTACALDTLRRLDEPIRLADALAFSPQSLDVLAGQFASNPKRDVAIPAAFAIPAETLLKKHL